MQKIYAYIKLPILFEAYRLQQAIQLLAAEAWNLHFQEKHYNGNWKSLALRSPKGDPSNPFLIAEFAGDYGDTPLLHSTPYLQDVLQQFKCPLLSVRLLKLEAGAQVHEHKDADLCFESGQVRLHIPVQTHDKVRFWLQGEPVIMNTGECWYINVNLPHALANEGETDRIHLVIDAEVNDWLKDLFENADPKYVKTIEPPQAHSIAEQMEIIANLKALNLPAATELAIEMEKTVTVSENKRLPLPHKAKN